MQSKFGLQFQSSAMVTLQDHHGVSGLLHITRTVSTGTGTQSDLDNVILGDEKAEQRTDETNAVIEIKFTRKVQVHTDSTNQFFCGVSDFNIGDTVKIPIDGMPGQFLDYKIEERTDDHISDVEEFSMARFGLGALARPGMIRRN